MVTDHDTRVYLQCNVSPFRLIEYPYMGRQIDRKIYHIITERWKTRRFPIRLVTTSWAK